MRRIRFRIQGSDARYSWFGDSISDAIKQTLTDKGWQVVTPVAVTRPAGWTGLTSLIFDFQVAVYDFYTDDYITNEAIKTQLRNDLSSILNIDWVTALDVGAAVAPDTGGFILDATNTQAIKDAKDAIEDAIPSFSIGIIVIAFAAIILLNNK